MEEKTNRSESSSSISDQLKANNPSSAAVSSSGYFSSIFEPPSKVTGFESSYFSVIEKKNGSGTQFSDRSSETGGSQMQDKMGTSMNMYNREETVQPFHYSSSLYYGGQDVYSRPQDSKDPGPITFMKEGKEDDLNSASRGNWWQGSLYY